jgi:Uma2 family endonuclease
MSTVTAPEKLLTVEEFLALPDDGRERWLIDGRVYPREPEMSRRNKKHSLVTTNVAQALKNWRDAQPEPRGQVHTGDASFRIRKDPDTFVGIDVAYVSAEIVARGDEEEPYFVEPPTLAVEILSPSDKHEEVVRKIAAYLRAGSVVWEIDPDFRRITVHQPGRPPEMFTVGQEIVGDPYLPGFRLAVKELFA